MHPTNYQKSHWGADPETKKRIRRLILFPLTWRYLVWSMRKLPNCLKKVPSSSSGSYSWNAENQKSTEALLGGLFNDTAARLKKPTWYTCWFSACQSSWWGCLGSLFLPNQPHQCKPVVTCRTLFVVKTISATKSNFIIQSHSSSPPLFPLDQRTSQLTCYKTRSF